jgi:hypothetical protein
VHASLGRCFASLTRPANGSSAAQISESQFHQTTILSNRENR